MPAKNTETAVYQAIESFSTTIKGHAYQVNEGDRVADGHELLRTVPHLFKPLTIHYPAAESATAEPGEKRGA